jgi:hypothetical protein
MLECWDKENAGIKRQRQKILNSNPQITQISADYKEKANAGILERNY